MDARLLRYYNDELRYLHEQGAEFAREFPKIAARLGIEGLEVSDPYVERLLEGCAFLSARVHLKLDAEFPRFAQRLLELMYPHFLAPVPSMLVAQVRVGPDANLLAGPTVARGTSLIAPASASSPTRCEFTTAQDLQLTPLQVTAADYFLNMSELKLGAYPLTRRLRSGIRVKLQLPAGMALRQLDIDALSFYMGGAFDIGAQVHELLLSDLCGVLVGAPGAKPQWLDPESLQAVGYADCEAMLDQAAAGFAGVRLLQEYFAFPERFLFVRLQGLRAALAALGGSDLELTFLFGRQGEGLDGQVGAEQFALHCVPAVNLFSRRADRIHLDDGSHEFHVVVDRTRPLDFEVYGVESLRGFDSAGGERAFHPLYAPDHSTRGMRQPAYFTAWREPRLLSQQAKREGTRSGYVGSEVFVSLVDPEEAPQALDMRELSVQVRCTNRDLPVFLQASAAQASYTLQAELPIEGAQVLAGPSRPQSGLRDGAFAWRLLNLLSLNHLSLLDEDGDGGALAALRELLAQFPGVQGTAERRQIEALQAVSARPVVRRHPGKGPIAFSRGLEVRLSVDELGHEGGSAHLFCAALHHYLSRHVSLNSFVQTVMVSLSRGEVMRWLPQPGTRPVL